MSRKDQLSEELIDLERALAMFEPAPSRVDRDRLMFDAGVARGSTVVTTASGTRVGRIGRGNGWCLSACAAALIACVFASLYVAERGRAPVVVREIVTVERSEPLAMDVVDIPSRVPRVRPEAPGTEYAVPSARYSALSLPFWPFTSLRPPTTSHQPQISSHQPPTTYFALRQIVLTRGVDALPRLENTRGVEVSSEMSRPPSTIRELMKEFLPPPANVISTDAEDKWQFEPTTYEIGETI